MDTKTRVLQIIGQKLGTQVNLGTNLQEAGADSLDLADIQIDLAEEFQIEISDDQLNDINTVGELVALIRGKIDD